MELRGFIKEVLYRLLQGPNQWACLILLGEEDLGFSAMSYIWHCQGKRHWPMKFIDSLFFWQEEHCKMAFRYEFARRQRFLNKHRGKYSALRKLEG